MDEDKREGLNDSYPTCFGNGCDKLRIAAGIHGSADQRDFDIGVVKKTHSWNG